MSVEKINLIVTTDAIADIQNAIDKVTELKDAIARVKTVSGSANFSDATKSQSTEIADLKNKLAMIASLNKQRYEQEAKLIADNDKALTLKSQNELKQIRDKQAMIASLNKQKKQEILANEKLNSAYNKLNKARADAKNTLRDLIASEKASTAEINKAQKAFDVLDQKVRKADRAVGDMSKNVGNYKSAFSGLSNLMNASGIGTGLYLAVDISKNIYETTKQLQSLDLALKMISDTQENYAKNTAFLLGISEKWGLEIKTTTEQFTAFYADAKGKLTSIQIEQVFEGIAKAGSIMGLSLEKQKSAFVAFQQMLSKGTIQAQELKLQLGDALPGSIKVATQAYQKLHPELKVTEQLLYKHMEQGKLISSEMIPLMVDGYQKLYGIEMVDKVDTLAAAQNRLKNSWTDYVKEVSSGNRSVSILSDTINFLARNLSTVINVVVKGTVILGTYLGVTKTLNFLTTQAVLITEAYAIAKSVLNKRTVENTVAENVNTASKVGQTGATVVLTGATEGATIATAGFNTALLANPIVAVIALVMAGVTAYLLLRDSTDDATTALIKYDQAKRDAEKQAVKDVKAISKNKGILQERFDTEVRQLNKLREIQKTASGDELKEINDRILVKKEEIELTKEKLRLEGIKVVEKSKTTSDKAYVASHKAGAERNSIELQKLKYIDSLNLALEKEKKYNSLNRAESQRNIAEIQENVAKIIGLKDKIAKAEQEIRNKNIEIIKQNKIFNELRPEKKPTGGTGGTGGNGTTPETEEQRKAREKAEEQRKAREKAEKDRLDAIERLAKEEYDLKISFLEKEKFIAQEKIDLINEVKQNEEIKFQDIIEATNYYNGVLLKIEKEKYDEEIRLAGSNSNLKQIATNKWFITTLKLAKESSEAILKVTKDFAKKDNEIAKQMLADSEENAKAFDEIEKRMNKAADNKKDALKQQIKLFNEFAGDFANKSGFSQTFDSFLKEDKNGVSLMDTLFDDDAVMDKEAKMKATFLAISSAAQDMFNLMAEASQRNFEGEYKRLDEQKEVALRFAGDSDAAKKKIEEDYEKRRKQIAVREFKAKQKMTIVNIAIDTAQAAMASWAKTGFPWAAAAAIAMGAIQIGIVASQKLPEFWRGTKNAPEGVAWTNEKGAEIHTDRHGNIKDFGTNKGATLTKMDAGDIVYTAEETRRMMFENEYNGLLAKNGITGAKVEVKNGMTAVEMDEVLSKHFSQIQTNTTVIDRNGLSQWSERNGNRTIEHSNRVSRTGFRV